MGSGFTFSSTITSPLGPPFRPASPWPRSATLWSSSTPAGMRTSRLFFTPTLPVPWQWVQGFFTNLPLPPQRWQGCWLCITPKGVRIWRIT